MNFVFWVISLSWNLFFGLLFCHEICLYSPLFFYFIWFVWYWLDVYNFLGDGSLCFTQFCAVVFFVWFGWLKHTCELKVEITRVRNRHPMRRWSMPPVMQVLVGGRVSDKKYPSRRMLAVPCMCCNWNGEPTASSPLSYCWVNAQGPTLISPFAVLLLLSECSRYQFYQTALHTSLQFSIFL